MSTDAKKRISENVVCPVCQTPVDASDARGKCPACHTLYHSECWKENGGCAVYGCRKAPHVEARSDLEIPDSYWGQDRKPCPSCGMEIQAAAIRCKRCGAVFESARPLESSEYFKQNENRGKAPALQQNIIVLFVFCLLPCTAPVASVIGLVWYNIKKSELKKLPVMYVALCHLGIGAGLVQAAFLILLALIYSSTGG